MLKVLGNNRLLFIFLVGFLVGGLSYFYYEWLLPAHEKSTQDLQTSKSAVEQKYSEVVRLKEEYVLLQSQLRAYKELEVKGFFNDQDRTAAVDKLDKLSKASGLLKASLRFGSGQLIEDPVAKVANQVVLKSPVSINVSSIDDVDLYSFVKFIEEKFPGRIDITSLSLSRIEIFDTAILRKIGGGQPTPLVESKLSFDWLTMAPKDIVAPSESNNQGDIK
jgi:Tfp pilus assembly protein PilO